MEDGSREKISSVNLIMYNVTIWTPYYLYCITTLSYMYINFLYMYHPHLCTHHRVHTSLLSLYKGEGVYCHCRPKEEGKDKMYRDDVEVYGLSGIE